MAQRVTSHPGQRVTIDGVSYRLEDLSKEAQVDLSNLQVTDQYIQRIQHRLAMLQTARAAYSGSLAGELKAALPGQPSAAADSPAAAPVSRVFWHNIGLADNAWWRYLVTSGQLAVGFDNTPGDAGESLMQRYRPGDALIAYASGKGAVGWARVETSSGYRLVDEGSPDDLAGGDLRHRLEVTWAAYTPDMDQAVSAAEIREAFGVRHPTRPSVAIDLDKGKALLDGLAGRFERQ
ncbi:DUF6447 family protein [Halomonas campisalis]|uniref:DUF6447 family protein n=1 Tax=Billgrantia campisalis TaxID=74661 RepID=UPI001EF08825|nr:DUF6447 family protein [Halomonas campisalis]MDR5864917.1 DUF6447 family protein [Halomonas campisalis]